MAYNPKARKAAKITLWVTIPILILSISMIFVFDAIYNKMLKKEIALAEGSLISEEVWKDIPLPIYERLYFFNITNEDAFLEGKPIEVDEVGPYTYKSRWVKPDPKWNPNNTVSYREIRTYEFVPEMSNGTQDDLIYSLNAPMLIAADLVRDSKIPFIRSALYLFLLVNSETLITKKSIRQLVYDGYEDAIIKDAHYIKDVPYKDGMFSWLYGKNATDDGLFTVFTGVDDASKTNLINNWNGQEKLSFWKGDSCNAINQSTSIETGPPIDGDIDSYSFYQSIFCRSLTFDYSEDTTHYDISSKRFRPTYGLLANGTENPDNKCFEVNKEHASGILDVSPCQFGAPVFISFPHFNLADRSYLDNINGLNPDDSKHGSHIDVEPITGLSIDLLVRFQINIEVRKVSDIFQFHNSIDGIYPVFWTELSLNIDEKMADFLKSNVRTPKIIAYSVIISVIGVCLILIIVSALFLAFSSKKDKDYSLIKKHGSQYSNTSDFSKESRGLIHAENASTMNTAASGNDKNIDKPSSVEDFARDSLEIQKEVSPKTAESIYPSIQ